MYGCGLLYPAIPIVLGRLIGVAPPKESILPVKDADDLAYPMRTSVAIVSVTWPVKPRVYVDALFASSLNADSERVSVEVGV